MTEIELVKEFAEARGLAVHGTFSKAGARGLLLPLLILDICYRYIQRLKPSDFRFKARHHVKEIHAAYNRVNGWFFAGLRDDLEDAAIDLMDQLERRLDLDILICDTAVWNVMKVFPEPRCGQLVACYMAYLLACAANFTWGQAFFLDGKKETLNKNISLIASESRMLARELMGSGPYETQDRLLKGLRDAESALGMKIGKWKSEE